MKINKKQVLNNWIESMLQRELALNKLLETEVNMLTYLLNNENDSIDVLKIQDKIVSLMDCLCNTSTLQINNFEMIVNKRHLL
ncbi:hypothetical protein [Bacillus paramycoides]|uniref:Uncharacterized protein n=1 Tax=Bacillus paramycoides TaxID=2026194 RepID=A0ABU6MWC3_9BACI|nr:hypothetical protein [Bacillus paramycoides]MED0980301.1 hypothetical protein [Bacillus paramycoides]MED0985372.1 hypothetical protein [Bacillus paramycoides]MED1091716.1 hypothetical protein [Bacillus paramycoides]MED1104405.1 hypothetical protein [Bacillus paramycoides]